MQLKVLRLIKTIAEMENTCLPTFDDPMIIMHFMRLSVDYYPFYPFIRWFSWRKCVYAFMRLSVYPMIIMHFMHLSID